MEPEKKEWIVIWHYIANYGVLRVLATTAADAAEYLYSEIYPGPEFKEKACVLVFEGPPDLYLINGVHKPLLGYLHRGK